MRAALVVSAAVLAMCFVRDARAQSFMNWSRWDWLKPLEPAVNHMGTSGQTVPAQSAPVTTLTNPTLEESRSYSTPLNVTISNGVNGNVLPAWRLVTQTYAGRIAITHSLTKDDCDARKDEALGVPHTDEEKAAAKMLDAKSFCRVSGTTADGVTKCVEPAGPAWRDVHDRTDIFHAECLDHAPGETK